MPVEQQRAGDRLTPTAGALAAARERHRSSCERYRRARGQHLLALQAHWRVRSKVYNRFGPVVAMVQEPDGTAWPGHSEVVPADGTACPTATIRALIAEADVPTRVGVHMILSSAGGIEVVGEVASGEEAVAWAVARKPDVVVTAIRLPGMDGISAAEQITAALGERTKVVVLTSFDSEECERQARRAGASAFVSKHAGPDELVGAVRAAATGVQPAAVSPRGRSFAAPGAALAFTPALTERERDVLYLVAQGLSNVEIGAQLYISIDTVRSHLRHIYSKSGVANRARLVVAAEANGFRHLTE